MIVHVAITGVFDYGIRILFVHTATHSLNNSTRMNDDARAKLTPHTAKTFPLASPHTELGVHDTVLVKTTGLYDPAVNV
jgi:hypothetical protein